ncbi:hypothetical protein Aca07nite_36710 [Actinoplanes capillaceus]|uniref:Uncharacterized protein n=1 Tax=Actinoplanes campanulatus TaxID=113559 RepID=A0ABQ3WJI2_9ACTN|nr:hypothetical protein [Actinoplanes capillaceus]GID46396.1 hypothetical protein Aca07nite_36710 [Actinoplanes capillaceus]
MRALNLTGTLALVVLAGACSQTVEHVGGAAQPVNGAPAATATSPSAAPTSPSTTSSTPTANPTTADKAKQGGTDPCPVSAATLFEVLRKSDLYEAGGNPDGMAKPNCYQGFAFGRSTFRQEPEGEIASILFKFDTKARAWKALNLGTGDICGGYVSEPVRDRLNQGIGGC